MYYDNDKLNEIYRDTWPNLGWAIKEKKEEVKETTESDNDRPT
jgi:hypothetical protein